MTDYCEGDVIETAKVLKQEYTKYRRQYDAGFRPTSDRHSRIWRKAADICLSKDIDPRQYVAAQFYIVPQPGPGTLSDRMNALDRYHQFIRERTGNGQMELYIDIHVNKVLSRARCGFDMRKYLADPPEILCPPVRYICAVVLGYADIAEAARREARSYGHAFPNLMRVIKDRFPGVKECQDL